MAHTEQLPSKKWRGIYRDSTGKRQRVSGTFGRKSDAFDAAQEAEVQAARQASTKTGDLSAKTPWGDWWEVYQSTRDPESQSRVTENKIYHAHLHPQWDEIPLNQVTQLNVQSWVDQLNKYYGASYVRRIYTVFTASINAAVSRGVLSASPCVGIRRPRVAKQAKPYLSLAEFAELTPHLPQPYRDAVELILETGLRPGELAGLHSHRIDVHRRLLWVADAHLYKTGTIRESPKDEDVRAVPLTTRALAIIQRQLADRDLSAPCGFRHIGTKRACKHPLVFYAARGSAMHATVLQRQLRKAAARGGLEPKTPYEARRGFATRLADGGTDSFEIARVMGHSNLDETAGYVQQSPSGVARVLRALDEPSTLRPVPENGTAWGGVGSRGSERGSNLNKEGFAEARSEDSETGS